jgi:tetratricopeptide (TPR) repeat protein
MVSEATLQAPGALLSHERLIQLAAEAYRTAALAGSDMRQVTEAIESIRTRHDQEGSAFDAWLSADEQIGTAANDTLGRILTGLREQLVEEIRKRALADMAVAFADSPEQGWLTWLRMYAEALDAGRLEVCEALAEGELTLAPEPAPSAQYLRTMTRHLVRERWPDVHDFLVWLAEQESLAPLLRARLRVYAGHVQLYHFVKPREALAHYEWAEAFAPDDHVVVAGIGAHSLQQGDVERSRELFRRSISLAPQLSGGYVLMGDSYERENDLDAAEEWYRETVKQKPGESEGYNRLIRLLGRPELLSSREHELLPLFERSVVVDPRGEYAACVEVGDAYRQSERYEDAHDWYDRAIALDPARLNGYMSKAYAYLDARDVPGAQTAFQAVVDVAPESFEGYWGLACAAEDAGQEDEALEWFQQSLPRRPAWEGVVRARIGELLVRQHRYREAETELLTALRVEPGDESILTSVHELADACFQPDSPFSIDESRRILTEIRAIAGEPYEHTFHNRLGNLSHYTADYESAIEAYRRAIELDPQEPVYHSNLANSWYLWRQPGRRAEELTHAISALRRARELDPEDPEYGTRLSALLAEQTVVRLGGETALELSWVLPLVRVEVSADMRPLIVDERGEELSPDLRDMIEAMQRELREATGLAIPGVIFRDLGDSSISESAYRVRIREMAVPLEVVRRDRRFCPAPLEPLVHAGIPAEVQAQALAGAWLDEAHWTAAEEAGLVLLTPVQYMLKHLESVLRLNLEQFVDHQQVAELLSETEAGAAIVGSTTLLTPFVAALRALVRERVPITALEAICEGFTALAENHVDPVELVERLRALPDVAASLPGDLPDASHYRLGPDLEKVLEQAVERSGEQPVLALRHAHERAVCSAVRERTQNDARPVLITQSPALRPFTRALIEFEAPNVAVIAEKELQSGAVTDSFPQIEVTWPG